jgi:Fic family protein
MPEFKHHDLCLPNPSFDSPLVDVLTELEYLRRLQLRGTTPATLFFQLKEIFHVLESLGSARIEGNHTTLADYVESRLELPFTRKQELDKRIHAVHAWRHEHTTEPNQTDFIAARPHRLCSRPAREQYRGPPQ